MSSITAPTYDPTTTATALAQKYTASAQSALTSQTNQAKAVTTALSSLSTAISSFQSSLSSLTGASSTMLAQTATLSDTSFGSASATGHAVAGTYDFFAEQIATAGKTTYSNLTDTTRNTGTLSVLLGGSATGIDVDLASASDANGTLTVRALAAAINNATGNAGQVSASVVSFGTNTQLILTSTRTGAATGVSLDLSAMGNGTLKTNLQNTANVSANVPQDAIVYIGNRSGAPVTQPSNTFTNVDGLAVTFTKAQASTDPNLTVTVKTDTSATTAHAQAFVDAYNKLKSTIDDMVAPADGNTGAASGAFAGDAGIKALQERLISMLRPGGSSTSLSSFGITSQRDGTLALDTGKLSKQLALTPDGLDRILGSTAASGPSGIASTLNTYLNQWSGSTGQLQHRQDDNTKLKSTLATRQDDLDRRYDAAYQRYLQQFTQLQALQSQMNSNVSLFDALFSNKSN
ncbi:flagellar filament capping protein FliD [Massilia sp. LXY-6]|uniref:flagellar filament capping protein FliD n=1 Tax=Massilia sp. LXY-6 TaxID=3379823 RepID=UPI003EE348F7